MTLPTLNIHDISLVCNYLKLISKSIEISEVNRSPIAHSTHIGQTSTHDKPLKHEVYTYP
jgi:hypothetical protein